jgi:transcriptional regulator of arginine metabolism
MHIHSSMFCQLVGATSHLAAGAIVAAGDLPPAISRTRRSGDVLSKRDRHSAILEAIEERPIGSQEELRLLLKERGWNVTQSTLSRDLRELRLARIPTPDGARYASPEALAEDPRTAIEEVLPQFFASIDGVSELLVLRTIPGGAQPIAEAIDAQGWTDVLGTIGGENTILIVCRSTAARERLQQRIEKLAGS